MNSYKLTTADKNTIMMQLATPPYAYYWRVHGSVAICRIANYWTIRLPDRQWTGLKLTGTCRPAGALAKALDLRSSTKHPQARTTLRLRRSGLRPDVSDNPTGSSPRLPPFRHTNNRQQQPQSTAGVPSPTKSKFSPR